ncbi:hypothetical protein HV262_23130 (plasmid) [Escherichia coli]|nr:hypothetical protein HV262_23130 [Escherichia coli]
MLGGADNPNGELPSYITGANTAQRVQHRRMFATAVGTRESSQPERVSLPGCSRNRT